MKYGEFKSAVEEWHGRKFNQTQLANLLGVTQGRIAQLHPTANLKIKWLSRAMDSAFKSGRGQVSTRVISAIETVAESKSKALNDVGIEAQVRSNWEEGKHFPQEAKLISVLKALAAQPVEKIEIDPIFEYKEIRPSKSGKSWRFAEKDLQDELQDALEGKYGVYIFYDSALQPVYVGKAELQDLFTRPKQSLATESDRKFHLPAADGALRKQLATVGLLARRFSAFEIRPSKYIGKIEALLIRGIINGTQNKRVEPL